MAAASWTEVPPNFITSIGAPPSIEIALSFEQFRVEQRRAGSAANRVVGEHGELPVQDTAGAKAADAGGHSRTAVDVEARLWAIVSVQIKDGMLGSAGQVEVLGFSAEFLPDADDLVGGRL